MEEIKNIGRIFGSPDRVACLVAERPRWLLPLLVFIIGITLAGYGSFKYKVEFQREVSSRLIKESGIQIDLDQMVSDTPLARLKSILFEAAGSVIFILLIPAALFNGIASVVGKPIGFRKMFTFTCYVGLILAAGGLIKIPLMAIKGSYDVRLSAAAFSPNLDPLAPLAVLLSSLDIFAIWAVIALCIGYHRLSNMRMTKAVSIVVGFWLLAIAILVALSYVRSVFVGRV